MELTPEQLRHLREQRRLTREELAKELDCSASAIVQWEGGKRAIPSWVGDKMFSKLEVTFSMEELAEIFELCREMQITVSDLFQQSVRQLITSRQKPTRRNVTYQMPSQPSSMAAEEPTRYKDKTGTDD